MIPKNIYYEYSTIDKLRYWAGYFGDAVPSNIDSEDYLEVEYIFHALQRDENLDESAKELISKGMSRASFLADRIKSQEPRDASFYENIPELTEILQLLSEIFSAESPSEEINNEKRQDHAQDRQSSGWRGNQQKNEKTPYKYDVFLSHNSQDKDTVEQIATRLDRNGVNLFLDKWSFIPGDTWTETLDRAIEDCKSIAIFFGPSGFSSYQELEIQKILQARGQDQEFRIIPVLLPGAQRKLPDFLVNRTWVEFKNGVEDDEALQILIAAIHGKAPPRPAIAPALFPLDNYTEDAKRALLIAENIRQTVRDDYETPFYTEFLLLGLMRLRQSPVKVVMDENNLQETSLLDHIEGVYGYSIKDVSLPDTPADNVRSDFFSANTEEVLQAANEKKTDPGAKINAWQIFIAMLENEKCVATEWLISEGVDIKQAIKSVENAPRVNLGDYGTPDGPKQRFDEIQAGIVFETSLDVSLTITALVKDLEIQRPCLLVPSSPFIGEVEIFQPSQKRTKNEDVIGTTEKHIINSSCMAATVRLNTKRPYLSTLPNGAPITGIQSPETDIEVVKFGSETGYTVGRISEVNVQLSNSVISGNTELDNVFFIDDPSFAEYFDIGAIVVSLDDNRAIGMIVGFDNGRTVCLPIQPILETLNVELITKPVRYKLSNPMRAELQARTDLTGGKDRLGFKSYVDAFVKLVQDTEPPLTIGIYGAWGTGKTFLMDKIRERLKSFEKSETPPVKKRFDVIEMLVALSKHVEFFINEWYTVPKIIWQKYKVWKNASQKQTGKKNLIVWFEAWDYNASDKLWAGLVERIFHVIESESTWLQSLRFNLRQNWDRQWRHFRPRWLPYSTIFLVALTSFIVLMINGQQVTASIIGYPTVIVFLKMVVDVIQTKESQRIIEFFARDNYAADIGFMGRIKSNLESFANFLPKESKVIVFIDDLDRCDPKKAVEVLEAVKLLLELDRFIVFLALDARIITQAIEEHYGNVLKDAEITGYEYLDKIVQIPFSIPNPKSEDLANYLGSLVNIPEENIERLRAEFEPEEEQTQTLVQEEAIITDEAGRAGIESLEESIDDIQPLIQEGDTPGEQISEHQEIPEEIADETINLLPVHFSEDEQRAFLRYYAFMAPNPRRIKRIANIYRLVRALIRNQADSRLIGLRDRPEIIMGWLILCEQWPYAAHMMMDILEHNIRQITSSQQSVSSFLQKSVPEYFDNIQEYIATADDRGLKKLDMKHSRLNQFIHTFFTETTLADVKSLLIYTVNFNPALSAEIQRIFAKGDQGES